MKMAPPDPILGTSLAYKADKDPKKINLGVGAYRDDNEKSYIFNVVRRVEQELVFDPKLDKEYAPIDGLLAFKNAARDLIFGKDNKATKEGRIVSSQTLSGTGALRVGFEFIKTHTPNTILVSNPTWGNHHAIINNSGLQYKEYPYYDPKTRGFNF